MHNENHSSYNSFQLIIYINEYTMWYHNNKALIKTVSYN